MTAPTASVKFSCQAVTARAWAVLYGAIGVLSLLTRFLKLGEHTDNGTPLFDEKHYVPQAWQVLQSTANPITGGIEDNPGYGLVVHPPVAKQIIAIGEWLFGYSPWGWRFMSALSGVIVVLVLMDIVRRLALHTPKQLRPIASQDSENAQLTAFIATAIAGIYAVVDGVLFVSSRVGMLDIIQTVFILLAVWALVIDNQNSYQRLIDAARYAQSTIAKTPRSVQLFGPYLSYRWWRLAAGVFLGLALGVKWSGLYYIAVFGLWSVFSDVFSRQSTGAKRPILGGLFRDTLPGLRDLVVVPIGVYLLSWRAWFAEETSVYRHVRAEELDTGLPFTDWLPESIQNYLHYQYSVLRFHAELTTSNGHHHPWESKPWEWLISWRPMLYYSADTTCMGNQPCKAWIMLFGTPPIWWLVVPVVLWSLWRWLARQDFRYSVVVLGFIASWVPWALAFDRQMYFFYATALIPFVLMGFAFISQDLWQATWHGRRIGPAVVITHFTLTILAFFFWLPIIAGISIPDWYFNQLFWLPRWS